MSGQVKSNAKHRTSVKPPELIFRVPLAIAVTGGTRIRDNRTAMTARLS